VGKDNIIATRFMSGRHERTSSFVRGQLGRCPLYSRRKFLATGTAAGVGAHLALVCDLVIMADNAKFIEVFARRGLIPDGLGTWILPRLIGLQKAKELCFFADDVPAQRALEIGLCNKVVPQAELQSTAREWAERLAGGTVADARHQLVPRAERAMQLRVDVDDVPAVTAAIGRAGATDVVERLPSRLETQLGATWPSGIEPSFGQWQKLALARGFMREQPLVLILDEPTAALDAETEHALFERYAAAARSSRSITILVSHRFSTVRMADLIVVLDGARVVEIGSHDALMAKRGQYAELYSIQAAAYR